MESKKIIIFFTFLLIGLIFPFKIFSQTNDGIVITPVFTDVTIEEGELEKDISITLSNNTKDPLLFEIDIAEIKQTDAEGNISYVDKPIPVKNAFPGFIEGDESLYLLPEETKNINIKIRNKSDLSPGGHYLAVIARVVHSSNPNTNASVAPALSSFLLINKKGGELYRLAIREENDISALLFKIPNLYLLTLENQGNVHVIPRGTIEIKDIFGRLVKKGIINIDSKILLSTGRRNFTIDLYDVQRSFPLMFYNIKVSGRSDLGDISFSSNSSFFYVSPYLLLVLAIFLLLLIFYLYIKKNKKANEI